LVISQLNLFLQAAAPYDDIAAYEEVGGAHDDMGLDLVGAGVGAAVAHDDMAIDVVGDGEGVDASDSPHAIDVVCTCILYKNISYYLIILYIYIYSHFNSKQITNKIKI
jgi:hypothetical protein